MAEPTTPDRSGVTPFTSAGSYKVFSDLFKEYWSTPWAIETIIVDNTGNTAPLQLEIGTPIGADGKPLAAASIANVYGLSGEDRTIDPNVREMTKIVVRGPGLLNQEALPKTDTAGAAIDKTAFMNALKAKDFQFLEESVNQSGWSNGPEICENEINEDDEDEDEINEDDGDE